MARLYPLLPADALAIAAQVLRHGDLVGGGDDARPADTLDHRDQLDEFEVLATADPETPPTYLRTVFYRLPAPALANLQMEWPGAASGDTDAWFEMLHHPDRGDWEVRSTELAPGTQRFVQIGTPPLADSLRHAIGVLEVEGSLPAPCVDAVRELLA